MSLRKLTTENPAGRRTRSMVLREGWAAARGGPSEEHRGLRATPPGSGEDSCKRRTLLELQLGLDSLGPPLDPDLPGSQRGLPQPLPAAAVHQARALHTRPAVTWPPLRRGPAPIQISSVFTFILSVRPVTQKERSLPGAVQCLHFPKFTC